jgi:hypothetical protein
MSDPTALSMGLMVKLASMAVHLQEGAAAGGSPVDLASAVSLSNDPEVKAWLEQIDPALLPVKR